ncbi:MAG: SDR family NAD(P)-dependent oxidoreductase [Candidatus Omnitrophica bacterium]|nr:SDR family NAD(P)-dependent oxidoreductase [Candidatus Omnitrophota bacterium]
MKRKSYLVTGGTGFIGSAIVRRLVKEGYGLRILDNNLRGKACRIKDIARSIQMINGDVRDRSVVEKAAKGMDGIIHLAYLNGTEFFYKRPELVLDIAVKGMINVLDSAAANKIKELILLSSSEVYQTPPYIPTDEYVPLSIPDPMNPRYSYGGGKIISELLAVNYGRKSLDRLLIVRPHNVYGPDMGWEHVIPQLAARIKRLSEKRDSGRIRLPIQGTGRETRSFCYIDDFVDGFMRVLKKGRNGNIYNVGTMEEVRIRDLAVRIVEYFGRDVSIVARKLAKGGTSRRCPDISKIKRLGYLPKIPLRKGLKLTLSWYDKNAHLEPRNRKSIEDYV